MATLLGALTETMKDALDGFGGMLRCETCQRVEPVGSPGERVMGCGLAEVLWLHDALVDAAPDQRGRASRRRRFP